MNTTTMPVTKKQIESALTQFSKDEVKSIFHKVMRIKNPNWLKLEKIATDFSWIVRDKKLEHSVIEEAKQWARLSKSK